MAVIRVSGFPNSGKTTLCRKLEKSLGYKYIYIGGILREMAAQANRPITEYYAELKNNPELERSIDAEQERLMCAEDNLIVEGRMAPWLKCGFKKINVLVLVGWEEGARRAAKRPENAGKTHEQLLDEAVGRVAEERKRYQEIYGIFDHLSLNNFDVLVYTASLSKDQVFEKAWSEIQIKLKRGGG